ncbi:protein of unknown function [Ralstonia solanacearum CFBP2957]|nr:protein of unknown function [Ralstonia solanacearum CFBP2957]
MPSPEWVDIGLQWIGANRIDRTSEQGAYCVNLVGWCEPPPEQVRTAHKAQDPRKRSVDAGLGGYGRFGLGVGAYRANLGSHPDGGQVLRWSPPYWHLARKDPFSPCGAIAIMQGRQRWARL